MRKSFDDTSSRIEDKYGEKFWQSQVQRMLKQSQNYSMLYNANKKIRDKEKQELKIENEKLMKRNKEVEDGLKKAQEELQAFKNKLMQVDLNTNAPKGKFIMKPKKRLQGPSQKGEYQQPKTVRSMIFRFNSIKPILK